MGKVTFVADGRTQEREFETEEEGKKLREELKAKGIKGKWEW